MNDEWVVTDMAVVTLSGIIFWLDGDWLMNDLLICAFYIKYFSVSLVTFDNLANHGNW